MAFRMLDGGVRCALAFVPACVFVAFCDIASALQELLHLRVLLLQAGWLRMVLLLKLRLRRRLLLFLLLDLVYQAKALSNEKKTAW